jgi:hypothetical protein
MILIIIINCNKIIRNIMQLKHDIYKVVGKL